ncbi:MAG TPA: hypothetical protein VKH61_10510 [Streptosporangiaceae bacterium]|nr:hypothetical protein [Streptosporangiaceae bacterium]
MQGDVERNAEAGRAGEPLGQPDALGRQVQDEDPARQVVQDDTARLL